MLQDLVLSVNPAHTCCGYLDLSSFPAAFSSRLPLCCPEGKMLLLLGAESDLQPHLCLPLPKILKQEERFSLSCLLLPWSFSHLHTEPWPEELKLRKLRREGKKLFQESSAWINGAKEQAEAAQLGVRRSLLMCCVRSLYRRLSSEVHEEKAFPV